jgi:HAD superfamily hydrolase (TIGR01509 family)
VTLGAIVFDFDGVIANSEPLHFAAFRDILAGEGIALSEAEYYAQYLGFGDVEAFASIGARQDAPWTAVRIADLAARKAVRLEALEHDVSILFPGAEAAIRRAAAEVPIAIASGALNAEIHRVLDRAGLTSCFTAIVGADDTPRSKPAPDPYLLALAQLSHAIGNPLDPTACVAIEDSRWGLQSARAAGLRTVAVTQTYNADELSADVVIPALAGLDIQILRRLVSE